MGTYVFSLSKALAGALSSLRCSIGRAVGRVKEPRVAGRRYQRFIKSKTGILLRQALGTNKSAGLYRLRRTIRTCTEVFSTGYVCGITPCRKVPRVLRRLGRDNVGLTILSGGPSERTIRIIRRMFKGRLFSRMRKRGSKIPGGPSPATTLAVTESLKILPKRSTCVKSSRISLTANRTTGVRAVLMS